MKKFSWIFALILALSIGFIGCPAADDDDDDSSSSSSSGGVSYNAAAQEIAVTFGASSGQTPIVKTKADNSEPGTIEYPSGAYKYTYNAASSYQNSILRFKITLADGVNLGDYSKVTFTWTADGKTVTTPLSPDQADLNGTFQQDINSNKKMFLLATNSAPNFVPDPTWTDEKPLFPLIASTDYFETNPNDRIWSGPSGATAGVKGWTPNVNGVQPQSVEIPIIQELSSALEGDVWVAIYVHSNEGAYTVSNLKFIPGAVDPVVNPTVSGSDAPVYVKPEPAGTPVDINLNITAANFLTDGVFSGAGTPTAGASGGVDVAFGASSNGQRAVIILTPEQTATINSRVNKKLKVDLAATIVSGAGDKFRYHIGDATQGGGWNATNSPTEDVLANVIGLKDTLEFEADADKTNGADPNIFYSDRPIHFILQHRVADAVTINITAVTITVFVDDLGSNTPAPTDFLESVGWQKVKTTDADLIGTYGSGAHEIAHSVLKVTGNGGFWVALPDDVVSTDTVTITYSAIQTDGTDPVKFIRKTGTGWTDAGSSGLYIDFVTTGVQTTIVVPIDVLDTGATKVYFQTNGTFESKIKIISVVKN